MGRYCVYFAEPHATANKSGTKILFGSNWRLNLQADTSIDAYVANVTLQITSVKNYFVNETEENLKLFPNPANWYAIAEFKIKNKQEIQLIIYDILGSKISAVKKQVEIGKNNYLLDVTDLKSGIYFLEISCKEFNLYRKLEIIK